jgi:hypothetical protein
MSLITKFNQLPPLARWGLAGAGIVGGLSLANTVIPDGPKLTPGTPVIVEGRFEGVTNNVFDRDKKVQWLDVEYCEQDADAVERGVPTAGFFDRSLGSVAAGCSVWRIGVERDLYEAVTVGQVIPLPEK